MLKVFKFTSKSGMLKILNWQIHIKTQFYIGALGMDCFTLFNYPASTHRCEYFPVDRVTFGQNFFNCRNVYACSTYMLFLSTH